MTGKEAMAIADAAKHRWDIPAGFKPTSAYLKIVEIVHTDAPVKDESPSPGRLVDRKGWIVSLSEGGPSNAEIVVDDESAKIIRVRKSRGLVLSASEPAPEGGPR
jgi:hypothetical protein